MTRPIARPKAVLFDLFHTLVSVPRPGAQHGLSMPDALGLPHAQAEIERLYYEEDVLDRCRGRVRDAHEIMRRVAHAVDPSVTDEAINAAVTHRRGRFTHALVNVDAQIIGALDRLREAGIRTALVSDAGFDDVEAWEESPLRDRLDVVVFSCEVGVRKPDPRIYRHALDRLNIEPRDAWFVGDGGSDEHRGARALGMHAVLVTRLVSRFYAELLDQRRPHADAEYEDVPAVVDMILRR